jgi:small subunit ribosomal protein S20
MPILKASIKHNRQTKRRTVYNSRLRARLQKAVKAFNKHITAADKKAATAALPKIKKVIDKATKKKILKPGNASRKISRLTKKLNKLITAKKKNVKTAKKST